MTTRGLLLAKALIESGEADLRAQGPFAGSIALLSLHDAIEFALAATNEHFSTSGVKVEKFEHYWKALPTLQMKVELDRMNKARVDLKHHRNTPDRDDVEEHYRNGRAFLGKVVLEFYKLDFETLSLVSTLGDGATRKRLEQAEEHADKENISEALIECAHAWSEIRERQSELYSQSWLVSAGLEQGMPLVVDRRIRAEVVHLHHQIRDLSGVMFAQTFGLNLVEYQFLTGILPTVRGTEITFADGLPDAIGVAFVRRCVELLSRYAYRLERELGAAKHPAWKIQ